MNDQVNPPLAPVVPPSQADIDAANANTANLQQQLNDQKDANIQQLQDYNQQLQQMQDARLNESAPAPVTPGLTAEQINEAMQSGEGGEKLLTGINNMIQQGAQKLAKEQIDPIRNSGTAAIAQLALNQAKADPAMPHFTRFEKEVKATLSQMNPNDRANPNAIELIYHNLVGKNHDLLNKEAHEATLRQQEQDATTLQQATAQRQQQSQPQAPQSLDESLSNGAKVYLERNNIDLNRVDKDEFARSTRGGGFNDFADMEAFKADRTENKTNYYAAKAAKAAAAQGGAQ